jgi:hypothetical protein
MTRVLWDETGSPRRAGTSEGALIEEDGGGVNADLIALIGSTHCKS